MRSCLCGVEERKPETPSETAWKVLEDARMRAAPSEEVWVSDLGALIFRSVFVLGLLG